MRYVTSALVLGLLLSLSACVPSLHGLYTEKDLVFDAGLLGEWVEMKTDSKSSLIFTKLDDQTYKLVSVEPSERSSYIAHLVKLGDKLFLDVSGDPSVEINTLALPVHMFFFVSQTTPTLRMRSLDPDWFKGFIKKNPSAIKHEIVEKDEVLTASTKELQSFVLRHLNTKGAYTDPADYVRKK
jgi:hypothetical protein